MKYLKLIVIALLLVSARNIKIWAEEKRFVTQKNCYKYCGNGKCSDSGSFLDLFKGGRWVCSI